MKKAVLILLSFLIFFSLSGCKINNSDSFKNKLESTSSSYEVLVKDFEIITVKEINKKISNSDQFLLYIGRKTCPYCQIFVPKLHIAAEKENTKIYYLDTENINENDEIDLFLKSIQVQYVPNLIYFNSVNDNLFLEIDSENITVKEIHDFITQIL